MTPSNRHYLRERLSGLRDRLLAIGPDPDGQGQVRAEADARRAMLEQRWRRLETEDPDLAIHQLRARTRLTPLDEEILSLAVGCATDPDLAALVAAAQAPIAEVRPTPWLLLRALATSSDERFDALTALTWAGTLARTGLVTWPTHDPALGPLARPFQAAPFAISFLLGDVRIDDRLAFAAALGSSDLTLDQVSLPPDGLSALRTMAALLARPRRFEAPARGFRPPRASLAVLAGSRGTGKSLVARALAGEAGAPPARGRRERPPCALDRRRGRLPRHRDPAGDAAAGLGADRRCRAAAARPARRPADRRDPIGGGRLPASSGRARRGGADHGRVTRRPGAGHPGPRAAPSRAAPPRTATSGVSQAERCARRAANRDSGTDGLYTLGKVELAAGRLGDAESTLLKVLDHDPAHVRAMEALADGRWARGDRAAAVGWLAHAYEAAPEAPEALEKLVDLYKEAGWAVGAILLSRLTRQGHHSDDVKVALDLVALLLSARLEPAFPALGVAPAVDEIVEGLLAAAASRRPAVQLHVARVLFDLGRHADCATVAARLDAQPMTAPERAEWHYLAGMVDDEAGRSAEALEHYEAALAADGSRWDACCNALHLLLNAPDRDQRRRIPGLLAAVPRALAWERPQLLANAALYLAGEGRLAEAREHLERVRELVDDQGPLADLVRERLADLGAS